MPADKSTEATFVHCHLAKVNVNLAVTGTMGGGQRTTAH